MKKNRKNFQNVNLSNSFSNRGFIENAGEVAEEKIVSVIEKNYMPYAMSVILSRAIPEIDGFKPSHRKLLYTMYKMNLLDSSRTKSANIVGQTMKLNPHGDAAIYETMVRLTRGYGALLHPFVDSKGSFGKFYSRDTTYAAARYTEARLDVICHEIFEDISKNTVDFVDNYDNTLKEPTLLPTKFPNILVNPNTGIAVGMACSICSFNLKEVCETTIELLKNPAHDVAKTLIAPDFSGGGKLLFDREKINEIYETGRGGFRVRADYNYDRRLNCIDIISLPPTTTSEAVIEKIIELVKSGKIREISDIRDETGLEGLKVTIDLKRGVDEKKLMIKLYKMTPLEDIFSCNFNVLINGAPRVLGVRDILNQWIKFRVECVRRRVNFDLTKKSSKLHLLLALEKILCNIDKAVKIIRGTVHDDQVIPNLMRGFSIDEVQAEFISEIKLRYLNREYILKKTSEIAELKRDITDLRLTLSDHEKIREFIINELQEIVKKYGCPRKTEIIACENVEQFDVSEQIENYSVTYFFTKEGYFKKILPNSLRMNSEQKLKNGDEIFQVVSGKNCDEILFFSDKCFVYKTKGYDFSDVKSSMMGEFIASEVGADNGESIIYMVVTSDFSGYMIFVFANGKVAKVTMKSYMTKTNRKRLVGAYSDMSKIVKIFYIHDDSVMVLTGSNGKSVIFNTEKINPKTTKNTQGVAVMRLKKGHRIIDARVLDSNEAQIHSRSLVKNLPSSGTLCAKNEQQLKF